MSFFVSCPINNALADPHKSGHQPTSRIIVKSTLHVRADLWGHADDPYLLRAWSKKDIPVCSLTLCRPCCALLPDRYPNLLRSYGFGLVTLPIWTSIHTVKGDVRES